MTWRTATYGDLYRIDLPDDPIESDIRGMVPQTEESEFLFAENTRTWEVDGRPIAIIGVSPFWKGVGVVWTLLSCEARGRGVRLSLGVSRQLKMLHEERGYWRIQATVKRNDEIARLWIVGLGFRYEGTMVGYGPDGATHDMYARVRG